MSDLVTNQFLLVFALCFAAFLVGLWVGIRAMNPSRRHRGATNTAFDTSGDIEAMIAGLKGELSDSRQDQARVFGTIAQELNAMQKLQETVQRDTLTLASSLQGNANIQGQWGEMQLKSVLENAGLLSKVHFFEQAVFEAGKNSLRPDCIVQLPENRCIVIDAKAPLSAYLSKKSNDEVGRSIRRHVKALSAKEYCQNIPQTPDFVLLFLPNDGLFAAATQADPEVLDWASKQQVLLVSPSTLIAVVKMIELTWRQATFDQKASRIVEHSDAIIHRLEAMATQFRSLGKSMRNAVRAYNDMAQVMEQEIPPLAKCLNGSAVHTDGRSAASASSVATTGAANQNEAIRPRVVENARLHR